MAAAKPLVVVIIAFLLAAGAAIPLSDGGGNLPFTVLPAEPPTVSMPDAGGNLPFTLVPAEPPAAECRGSVGMCPTRDKVPGLGARAKASTMAADIERVRRVHHQQRDSVPCSRRGASYYNCRPGAQDSPYRHACSRIKHCHG